MCHNPDCNEIAQLVVQAFELLAGTIGLLHSFISNLFSQLVAPTSCEFERLGRVMERLLELIQERVAIRQIEVRLSQWQQVLIGFRIFTSLKCLFQILNTKIHICIHISVLRQIIKH